MGTTGTPQARRPDMSTKRRTEGVYSSPAPEGPNGERLCYNCHGPMPDKDRRRFNCSRKCSEEWRCKTSASYLRMTIRNRDRGICAACGRDCIATGQLWEADHIVPVVEGGGECGLDNYRTLCIPCHKKETKALAARLAAKRAEQATARRVAEASERGIRFRQAPAAKPKKRSKIPAAICPSPSLFE